MGEFNQTGFKKNLESELDILGYHITDKKIQEIFKATTGKECPSEKQIETIQQILVDYGYTLSKNPGGGYDSIYKQRFFGGDHSPQQRLQQPQPQI